VLGTDFVGATEDGFVVEWEGQELPGIPIFMVLRVSASPPRRRHVAHRMIEQCARVAGSPTFRRPSVPPALA
jgi:hypothetical protein